MLNSHLIDFSLRNQLPNWTTIITQHCHGRRLSPNCESESRDTILNQHNTDLQILTARARDGVCCQNKLHADNIRKTT